MFDGLETFRTIQTLQSANIKQRFPLCQSCILADFGGFSLLLLLNF
ncbi:Uncharacterised protein [Klebsiella pneumoniae subsp. ozaenae]|uniref:Uncharacterized protein n=1 Tax=Klebsiella pneumoniae subsp. ozaenae TaxID=574 RepID=A0A377Z586_KLEPO|nr:Uncharacterised protein [Klebsiella pneumoniae subsp. ozaenae]